MKKTIDITSLRQKCPLPNLLQLVGLGEYAKSSCESPFCQNHKLWHVFQYQGRWIYKDICTGELGDEIGLLARLNKLNPHDDLAAVLKIYQNIVSSKGKGSKSKGKGTAGSYSPTPNTKPNATGFHYHPADAERCRWNWPVMNGI